MSVRRSFRGRFEDWWEELVDGQVVVRVDPVKAYSVRSIEGVTHMVTDLGEAQAIASKLAAEYEASHPLPG